jgi:L,D-transpeptidase YcbB
MKNIKCLISLLALLLSIKQASANSIEEIKEAIRLKVELLQTSEVKRISGDYICASVALPSFYQKRNFQPAWTTMTGLNLNAQEFIKLLSKADQEGLNPLDYHISKVKALHHSLIDTQNNLALQDHVLVDLDLLLTDAYLLFASHLYLGKLNPETIAPEWKAQKRTNLIYFDDYLENALKTNSVNESLTLLIPTQPEYQALKKNLQLLTAIFEAGGWRGVSEGDKLEVGMRDTRVDEVYKRLQASGYISFEEENRKYFDNDLKDAVRSFQRNHGLDDDGIVGASTLYALNVSVEDRITQVKVNMERWRWLPDDMGERHIRVNISNFELELVEHQETILTSKAIVGRTYRKTPVFSATMTYLVLNPYWTIPPGILRYDVIPAVQKDVSYLAKKRIKVLDQNGKIVDPNLIEWQTAKTQQYIFRQDPGKDNSLGLLKFMFPNRYSVYIHDTPSKELFEKDERVFSSGCIRIQKPFELAELLLQKHEDWNREKLEKLTKPNSKTLTVMLKNPITVHILYLTASGEGGKHAQFRNDIYNRDKAIAIALSKGPQEL